MLLLDLCYTVLRTQPRYDGERHAVGYLGIELDRSSRSPTRSARDSTHCCRTSLWPVHWAGRHNLIRQLLPQAFLPVSFLLHTHTHTHNLRILFILHHAATHTFTTAHELSIIEYAVRWTIWKPKFLASLDIGNHQQAMDVSAWLLARSSLLWTPTSSCCTRA